MFYLSLIKGFGLEIDPTPLKLRRNCFCALAICGVVMHAISMYRAGVGL